MHPLSTMLLVLALTPILGHAAYSLDNVTASCSDALTISQSGGVSFQCMGNFTLTGEGDAARLFSDSAITLSASGDLILKHLSILSPHIQLLSTGQVTIGSDVRLSAPQLGALVVAGSSSAGTVTLNGGASLSPSAGVVPEPATALLTLLGISGLLLRRRA